MKKAYILLLSLAFLACDNSEIIEFSAIQEKQQIDIEQIKKEFATQEIADNFYASMLRIKWNSYEILHESVEYTLYEFETNLQSKIENVKKSDKEKTIFSNVKFQAKKFANGEMDFTIQRFLGNDGGQLKRIRSDELSNFTGNIKFIKLSGDQHIEFYTNGKKVKNYVHSNFNAEDLNKVPEEEGFTSIPIFVMRKVDWYNYGTDTDGNFFFYYVGTTESYSHTEYVSIDLGYSENAIYHEHNDNPAYTGPHGGSALIDTHVEEINRSSSFMANQKINCTYEQLMKLQSMQQLLNSYIDPTANKRYELNLDIQSSLPCTTTEDVNACISATPNPEDKSVNITFSATRINDPNKSILSIARTIIHESIHAALYVEVKDLNGGYPSNKDYASLLESFRNDPSNSSTHPIMSAHYIEMIKQTLKDIHPILDPNFINQTNYWNPNFDWDKFYTYFAFQGLEDTPEGQEHASDPNYNDDRNIYIRDHENSNNSTKTPVCEE